VPFIIACRTNSPRHGTIWMRHERLRSGEKWIYMSCSNTSRDVRKNGH